jgi:hypothetical protein
MIMRYYGDLLVGCAAASVAALLCWRFPRRTPLHLAAGIAMSLIALDLAFYLSRLLAAV